MKKSILTLALIVLITSSALPINIIICNSVRSGGVLGLYGNVIQSYVGTDVLSGIVYHGFDLDCSGYGLKRCRVSTLSNTGGISGLNPAESALYNFSIGFVNEMKDDMEYQVSTGTLSSNFSNQYAWDKNGDGSFESLVSIKIEWTAEDQDFNDGESIITISEIDYPY